MGNWLSKFDRRSRLLSEVNTPWYNRRVWVLSRHLARAIPNRGSVLDIGAGDGQIAMALMRLRPDLNVEGIDIASPPRTLIPVTQFDGARLPFADGSFDYITLVDVLHQTIAPVALMSEASRVARHGVVVKDHLREGFLAGPTLTFMDWFGNLGDGPRPSRTFLTRRDWQGAFFKARLELVSMEEKLGLYLPPTSWLFDRQLHFVAYLTPK